MWHGEPAGLGHRQRATTFAYDGDALRERVKKVSPSGTVAYVGSHYEYNINTGGASWITTSNIPVTWNGSTDSQSGVAGYVLTATDGTQAEPSGTTYTLYWQTSDTTLASLGVRARDNVSNESAPAIATFGVDRAAPTCALRINGNATWTNVPTVTLDLSGSSDATSGAYQAQFRNDAGAWSGWETFNASRTWTLSNGDGTRTVSVRLSDRAGWTNECSGSIGLDATPPTGVSITGTPNGTAIALTWSANASVAGLHHYDVDVGSGVQDLKCSNGLALFFR